MANTTSELVAYAEEQISELDLGPDGPLDTEFVCVYGDAGDGMVRVSDGHAQEICSSRKEIDRALQAWVDSIDEG